MSKALVKRISILLFLFGLPFWSNAQIVATINDKAISSKEFLWVYKKNNLGKNQASYQELANYLELYINFKLKVLDAQNLGLDKEPSYIDEIMLYEKALKAQRKAGPKQAEFDLIMREYREGVLMFNISEQKIWNKAMEDEIALRSIFDKNQSKFKDKSFEEVRGDLAILYQIQLEQEWLSQLKQKHLIQINEGELRKLAKPENAFSRKN